MNFKLLLPALALPALLAACGTASTADGSVSFTDLKSEYRTTSGVYVGCDNVINGDAANRTAVAMYYSASGTIQSIDFNLKGATTNNNDGNYTTSVSGSKLQNVGGSNFKTVFFADSLTGGLLPNGKGGLSAQSIIVQPNANVAIKTVTTSGPKLGSFGASLTLHTASGNASTSTLGTIIRTIDVYSTCTVTGTTSDTL